MSDDSEHHKGLLLLIIVVISSLVVVSSVATFATQETVKNPTQKKTVDKKIKKPEPLKKIKTIGKNAPLKVYMNKTHIIIKGSKCSCGANYHGYKRHKTVKFKNYCPYCKKYGLLVYNKKRVAEGELTCKRCDYDACCVDGNDKSGKFRKKLKRWK